MNETSLKRAAQYLLLGSSAVLLGGWLLCGCATPTPPGEPIKWKSPPVKYSLPAPPKQTAWNWPVGDWAGATGVKIEWDYPENERSNIVFRVYGSERPSWDTNWIGWYCIGETPELWFSRVFGPMSPNVGREFYTVTASNTLTGLESDPARRE